MVFTLTSPAFKDGGTIPRRCSCDGDNRSPTLNWADPPPGTRSLVLVLHDPASAQEPDCVHWLLFDIPPHLGRISEGGADAAGLLGRNDFGGVDYVGPCPERGEHQYVFDLYALDVGTLGPGLGAGHDEVEAAIEGHLLGRANLVGRYGRIVGAD